jgi:hypothetical protein
MNPPTEQLIRDYLNRVSVAARGRLPADDRRAFVARTREFIDQNTRALGRIQTADVLKLLSELGDPLSLVNAERQRLAAGATEPGADTPADTSLAARARRLRAAPANVASLLRASATVVAPGDAPVVAEPAEDNPMTGDFEEIVHARRPLASRWKPGEIVIPRQPGQRRPGLSRRRPRPGVPPAGSRPQPSAPAEPAPSPQAEPEPLAGDIPPPRPEWPSDPARRPAAPDAEETPSVTRPTRRMPFAASGSAVGAPSAPARDTERDTPRDTERGAAPADDTADGGPGPDWASLSPAETDWAVPAAAGENWTEPTTAEDRETGASGPSASSLTNGAEAGHSDRLPDAPADRTPPDAGAPGRKPGPGGPESATGAGPATVARPGTAAGPGAGSQAGSDAGTEPRPESVGATGAATAGSGSVGPAGTAAAGVPDGEEPRPVNRNTLIGSPAGGADAEPAVPHTLIGSPAGGADAGPGVPPRGARVTWAAGVRSRAMRMGAVRAAGARLSSARPGGSRRDQRGPAAGAESSPATGPERGPVSEREGEFLATAGAAAGRAVRVVVSWARRHPLESVAVVLLGLGGLIYPPVWLMGALVAAFSKIWSIRDKWIGLVLPVFLVIVGIVVEVSLDGTHRHWTTYVRDAWLFAGHLSRILALLGAVYLAWRAERGPRSPGVPPWQRSGRFG